MQSINMAQGQRKARVRDLLGSTGEKLTEEVTNQEVEEGSASLLRGCGMKIPGRSSQMVAQGWENLVRLGN